MVTQTCGNVAQWPKNLRPNFETSGTDRASPEHFKSSYCFRQSPFSPICLEHATDTLLFHFHASASGKESTVLALHMTVKNSARALRGLLGTRASCLSAKGLVLLMVSLRGGEGGALLQFPKLHVPENVEGTLAALSHHFRNHQLVPPILVP